MKIIENYLAVTLRSLINYCFILLLSISVFSCKKSADENSRINIFIPKGPPAVPAVYMASKISKYNLIMYDDLQTEVLPKIIREKQYLFIIPTNTASKLYNSGADVSIVASISSGFVYVITVVSGISSIKDLDKKKIKISAPGSSPAVIAEYLFKKYDVSPEISYGFAPEITALFLAGKVETAVLPEPFVTMVLENVKNTRIAFSLKDEYLNLEKSSRTMPQVCLAGNGSYIKSIDVDSVLEDYSRACDWVNKNKYEAAEMSIDHISGGVSANVVADSIGRMNLKIASASVCKDDILIYLKALKSEDPKTIGGKIPDDKIFFH